MAKWHETMPSMCGSVQNGFAHWSKAKEEVMGKLVALGTLLMFIPPPTTAGANVLA